MLKLILSILGPFLFIANYWICEAVYPGFDKDWNVFIPMDKLSHNFWAVILFIYALINTLKTEYPIINYFLYVAMCMSVFDIWARVSGLPNFDLIRYVLALLASFIISGIIYGTQRKHFS